MVKVKLNLTEVFQSVNQEARREILQSIVDSYLHGAITSASASAHP